MPRSQPKRPRPRSDADWSRLIGDLTEASPAIRDAGLAILRRDIGDHIEYVATLPVPWLDACPRARRELARLVLERLEANDFYLLTAWRGRRLRRRDHCAFATMVKTVLWYVSFQYAA
jgi:hypothetical protein